MFAVRLLRLLLLLLLIDVGRDRSSHKIQHTRPSQFLCNACSDRWMVHTPPWVIAMACTTVAMNQLLLQLAGQTTDDTHWAQERVIAIYARIPSILAVPLFLDVVCVLPPPYFGAALQNLTVYRSGNSTSYRGRITSGSYGVAAILRNTTLSLDDGTLAIVQHSSSSSEESCRSTTTAKLCLLASPPIFRRASREPSYFPLFHLRRSLIF